EHVDELKAKREQECKALAQTTKDQAQHLPSRSRPSNFSHLSRRHWPQLPAEDPQRPEPRAEEVESGSSPAAEAVEPAGGDDKAEERGAEAEELPKLPPFNFRGAALPFRRKSLVLPKGKQDPAARPEDRSDFQTQLRVCREQLQFELPEPTEAPAQVPPGGNAVTLDEAGCRFITIQRPAAQVFRRLRDPDKLPAANGSKPLLAFEIAAFHVHQGIAIAGAKEVIATSRSFTIYLDITLAEDPLSFVDIPSDQQGLANLYQRLARARSKIAGAAIDHGAHPVEKAVRLDQQQTGEKYDASDVMRRLHESLGPPATATSNLWALKLQGTTAVDDVVSAILSHPESTLPRLERLLATLSPNLARPLGHFADTTTRIWARLAKDKTRSRLLINEIARFLLERPAAPWEADPRSAAQPLGGIVFPDCAPGLKSLVVRVCEEVCINPTSVDQDVFRWNQGQIDDASTYLINVIEYLAFLLPRVFSAFVGRV
ncbi:hypothetical protein JCM3766R1_002008, partial [Sporobolomyces carnicolor]